MNKKLLKDNFFQGINEKWLKETKIPSDRPATGAFYEIDKKNEIKMFKLVKNLVNDYKDKKLKDTILSNFVRLYNQALNYEQRDKLAFKPVKKYLKEIENLKNLNDYKDKYVELFLKGYANLFEFSIYQDFKDSTQQILYLGQANIILPDVSYYDDNHPKKTLLLNAWSKMMFNLLTKTGYSVDKSNKMIQNALTFDALLAQYFPTNLEQADYLKIYNPKEKEYLNSISQNFKFYNFAQTLVTKKVDMVSITYPRFFDNVDKVLNENNFKEYKDWMILKTLHAFARYLSNEARLISGEYAKTLNGLKKLTPKNKAALNLAIDKFSMPLGVHFAKKYLGEEAKKDVENKVQQMINIYAQRLQNNNWLSQKTKEKALIKLNSLGVHIGYPNEIRPYYQEYQVYSYKQGYNLLDNIINLDQIFIRYHFNQYKEPINKNYWSMPANIVNAYYSPTMNHIVFPAGILSAPFYSPKQSSSANFGGIGAVIAHEISHAFDNHGAQFDENGNKNMWWTAEDFAKFEELGKKMIELFDQKEIWCGKCDGQLTLSENIADGGGISCALEASMQNKDHSSFDFFVNWATIWRTKATENYAQNLLKIDVHAPAELRANLQLQNLDEFYKTFDIKPEDKMYLPVEKRVKIW
ncbi:M13 family metallopeptidase [Mycoplasma sp. 744]|uniref:M13 family metallopeptidase n=1 Tax=Mycoplasma sp. 744 TaxID=3108531 RepID=UPI002B1DDD27|nr:M13 family metallopeptidase [Mycoplasma sp. 744]MEA4115490.1 M13 family metallopeptidase [Mycoplasma sp. 744]